MGPEHWRLTIPLRLRSCFAGRRRTSNCRNGTTSSGTTSNEDRAIRRKGMAPEEARRKALGLRTLRKTPALLPP